MLVKKEKLMAQTTTKHCLGLFHGPFDSFPGVDGVGSGAVVVLVNNVSIIIIKNMIKNIPGAASRAPRRRHRCPFSLPVLAVDGAIVSLF